MNNLIIVDEFDIVEGFSIGYNPIYLDFYNKYLKVLEKDIELDFDEIEKMLDNEELFISLKMSEDLKEGLLFISYKEKFNHFYLKAVSGIIGDKHKEIVMEFVEVIGE